MKRSRTKGKRKRRKGKQKRMKTKVRIKMRMRRERKRKRKQSKVKGRKPRGERREERGRPVRRGDLCKQTRKKRTVSSAQTPGPPTTKSPRKQARRTLHHLSANDARTRPPPPRPKAPLRPQKHTGRLQEALLSTRMGAAVKRASTRHGRHLRTPQRQRLRPPRRRWTTCRPMRQMTPPRGLSPQQRGQRQQRRSLRRTRSQKRRPLRVEEEGR
mmetsp:Transcript_70368/g.164862  ORF Transcript_70368/g.164862 Transcript_70368/m.164862 type:complete len:214 (+) Transcript_70368:299-940(+)